MRKLSEKFIRRFTTKDELAVAPKPEEDLFKPQVLLPEDLLLLQQEFSEHFSCLQEEVRSDLSRAHLNVGVKLRTYGELLIARQQTLLESMIIKPPGTAPATLFAARQELARHDRPHSNGPFPLSGKSTPAKLLALEHERKWRTYPLQEKLSTQHSVINGNDDVWTETVHDRIAKKLSTPHMDMNGDDGVETENVHDRIARRLSDMNGEDDLVLQNKRSTWMSTGPPDVNHHDDSIAKNKSSMRLQQRISTDLPDFGHEDEPVTKQDRSTQFPETVPNRFFDVNHEDAYVRKTERSTRCQERDSTFFSHIDRDDAVTRTKRSIRPQGKVSKHSPILNSQDHLVTKKQRSTRKHENDPARDTGRSAQLEDRDSTNLSDVKNEDDPVTRKERSAKFQERESVASSAVKHEDDTHRIEGDPQSNRGTRFREKLSDIADIDDEEDHLTKQERYTQFQERDSTCPPTISRRNNDFVQQKGRSTWFREKFSTCPPDSDDEDDSGSKRERTVVFRETVHEHDCEGGPLSTSHPDNGNGIKSSPRDSERDRSASYHASTKSFSIFSQHPDDLDVSSEQSSVRSTPLAKLEQRKEFDLACAVILLGNALFIGIQVEVQDSNKPSPALVVFDILFTLAFVAELVVRMGAAGSLLRYFTKPGDMSWNWFDFIVTSFAVVESFLSLVTQGSENALATMRVVRVLRVLRMIRVVRIIRVMRFFRSLRILIAAILGTMKSGIWTAGLLIMIIYLFALVFAQAAVDHLVNLAPENELTETEKAEKLILWTYFGTLPRSIFTLWKAIVGGMDWETAAQSLSDVSGLYVAIFMFYIVLLYLAVLNVVAGLFLQTAVEQAQSDMNDVAHEVRAQRQWYIALINEIFCHADKSNDGIVSLVEFEEVMVDPKMKDFLALLGLQVSDAWTLFKLLDSGGTHGVDADDFVEGCLRLRGQARSLDIAQLMYESKWMRDELFEIHNYLRIQFEGERQSTKNVRKGQMKEQVAMAPLMLDVGSD